MTVEGPNIIYKKTALDYLRNGKLVPPEVDKASRKNLEDLPGSKIVPIELLDDSLTQILFPPINLVEWYK